MASAHAKRRNDGYLVVALIAFISLVGVIAFISLVGVIAFITHDESSNDFFQDQLRGYSDA
jgi:hypothetical protein